MKTLITCIYAVLLLSGCCRVIPEDHANKQKEEANGTWIYVGNSMTVRITEIGGHEYVLLCGYKSGGIVHAASCRCMNK